MMEEVSRSAHSGDARGQRLRLIEGGRREAFRIGSSEVRLWTGPGLPAGAGALVCEEDTMQVLGAPLALEPLFEHPVRVLTAASAASPATPGTVLVRAGRPLLLRAVVHDLDRDPSWSEGWIAEALREVLRLSARLKLGGVALPLLGTIHGRMPPTRALRLTWEALVAAREALPRRLWLLLPAAQIEATRERLDGLTATLD